MSDTRKLVQREVRVDDPDLSPEANERLTREVREAIGSDRVEVPAERADELGRVPEAGHSTFVSTLAGNRALIVITFAALVVVGAIVALATDSWWAVVGAAGIHALGTVVVIAVTLRMSTSVEHLAPGTAARLEEEGVADPDRAVSDLIEQYAPTDHARGAAEVVSSGDNAIGAAPGDDPLRAGVEQRSAMTPAGAPVGPAERGAPAVLPIAAVAGSTVVAIVVALVLGGRAWALPAVVAAAGLAWLALARGMRADRDGEAGEGTGRDVGDGGTGRRRRLLPTLVLVVAAVMAGVAVVGWVGGLL